MQACDRIMFLCSAYESGEGAGPFSDDELWEAADYIRTAVERKLHSGCTRPETAPCRRDILYFWFSDQKLQNGSAVELGKEHFPVKFFPPGWDMCMDVHGQGQRVHYPVTVTIQRYKVDCSQIKYTTGRYNEHYSLSDRENNF